MDGQRFVCGDGTVVIGVIFGQHAIHLFLNNCLCRGDQFIRGNNAVLICVVMLDKETDASDRVIGRDGAIPIGIVMG